VWRKCPERLKFIDCGSRENCKFFCWNLLLNKKWLLCAAWDGDCFNMRGETSLFTETCIIVIVRLQQRTYKTLTSCAFRPPQVKCDDTMCVFSCHYICLTPVHFNAKMTGSEITWKLFHRFLAAGGRTRVKSLALVQIVEPNPSASREKKKRKFLLLPLWKGFCEVVNLCIALLPRLLLIFLLAHLVQSRWPDALCSTHVK
jgi:hypothetical protein